MVEEPLDVPEHVFHVGVLPQEGNHRFVAAGQVYGLETPWANVRASVGVGLRVWVQPNVLGRVDVAWGGEGLKAYVVLGYPY